MTTLQKTIYIKAPKEKVWAYLTDPDKLSIWFHKPKTTITTGSYEMFGAESGDRLMWGDVLISDPFETLRYTFTIAPMGDTNSTVTWTLTEVAGGTRLALLHEGLPEGEDAFGLTLALDNGWDDHLARLRADAHQDGS
jgi:uncharacterized protein YndB with AHSA1/START domain